MNLLFAAPHLVLLFSALPWIRAHLELNLAGLPLRNSTENDKGNVHARASRSAKQVEYCEEAVNPAGL